MSLREFSKFDSTDWYELAICMDSFLSVQCMDMDKGFFLFLAFMSGFIEFARFLATFIVSERARRLDGTAGLSDGAFGMMFLIFLMNESVKWVVGQREK